MAAVEGPCCCRRDSQLSLGTLAPADEARSLKAYKELPENIRVNDADAVLEDDGADDGLIDFGGT